MRGPLPTVTFEADDGWTLMHISEPWGEPIVITVLWVPSMFGQEGAGIQLSEVQEEALRIFLNLRKERRVK